VTTSPTFDTEQQLLMPWMPAELVAIYTDAYVEHGDPTLAWQVVRQSEAYPRYFAGNRRDDGTLRLTEQDYIATIEGYKDAFVSIGINPRFFEERFTELIEGDVSVPELYQDRLQPIYERVFNQGPAILAEFADQQGLDLSYEAIIAGIIDPSVGERILNKQITMAEIGGEAAERGFDIAIGLADELFQQGLDQAGAERFFGEAAMLLPTLSVLARRHADPDDEFDLTNFVASEIYDDPQQRRRIRRLVAQEQSLFGNITGQTAIRTREGGLRTGLESL